MKSNVWKILILLIFTPLLMQAGGYQVKLQNNRANGMGLIGGSFELGAPSVFFNPGALSFSKSSFEVDLGTSLVFPNVKYQDSHSDYSATTDSKIGTPVYLYLSYKLMDDLQFGLGMYTPYGSSVNWDKDWKGKYLIQDIKLASYFIQPTLSYKLTDWLGFGAGLVIAQGSVDLNRALTQADDLAVNLKGDSEIAYGYNLGLYIKPNDVLSFGVNYRSKIELELKEADATFNSKGFLAMAIPPNNKFSSMLPMPANLDMSVAYKISKKITLAAEVDYVFWGTYKDLEFQFNDASDRLNSVNPREYSDVFVFRVGSEYKVNENLQLRLGAYYDNAPTNDEYFTPETVSLNSLGFTGGATYSPTKNIEIDLSVVSLSASESDRVYHVESVNFGGTYDVYTFIAGLGVKFKL